MRWIMLFLIVNCNVLAGAVVYRVYVSPEALEIIEHIHQKTWALHKDHVWLESQHLILSKQLTQCLGCAI